MQIYFLQGNVVNPTIHISIKDRPFTTGQPKLELKLLKLSNYPIIYKINKNKKNILQVVQGTSKKLKTNKMRVTIELFETKPL